MNLNVPSQGARALMERPALQDLISYLRSRGYEVVGPRLRDGAIVYDSLEKIEDLPIGWTDEPEAGRYRVKAREDQALFGYTVGAQNWKKYLHPPELCVVAAERDGSDFKILRSAAPPPKYAFLGVRACELAAIRIHDRVFLEDRYVEPGYQARRQDVFVAAVLCTRASPTCFCTSFGTGPRAQCGYDLALTELAGGGRFVVEAGSAAGREVLSELGCRDASAEECREADEAVERAAEQIVRHIDTGPLRELLYESFSSAHWGEIATRCLSCGNCTMVCPTCFCTTVEDVTDIPCRHAERWRKWDSCFTESFSYIHGGSVRMSVKSRHRQWLTHKLAAWVDQFGTFGCVGCGRCITWCPAGIDITEEVKELLACKR